MVLSALTDAKESLLKHKESIKRLALSHGIQLGKVSKKDFDILLAKLSELQKVNRTLKAKN